MTPEGQSQLHDSQLIAPTWTLLGPAGAAGITAGHALASGTLLALERG
jgi:hypothetical protein